MDIESVAIAQAYADELLAGATSGVVSHLVDEESNSITFNFADGTSTKMTISAPQAKVDAAVNNYLAENIEKPNYYSNVEEMKADNTLKAGKKCITLGYYEPNDGGRSTYLIRAKTDSDTDNGGSILVLNDDIVAELMIENNTLSSKQFGARADGETDDYPQMLNLYRFVNSYSSYLDVILEGTKMLLSNGLVFKKSNLKVDIHCDIALTKAAFTAYDNMCVLRFGNYETRTPVTDVYIYGHGHTIYGNGNAVDFTENDNNLPNAGEGIELRRIWRGGIYNVHVDNTMANGILLLFCKDIVVSKAITSNTVVNNGLTVMEMPLFHATEELVFDEKNDYFHSNILIDSCESYGNKDLGFTTGWAIGVTFRNCYSHDNGNAAGWNAGGGYSNESFNWVGEKAQSRYTDIGAILGEFDTKVTFERCRAVNNNNFGFYADKVDTTILKCVVDGTVQTSTTADIRKGYGILCNTVKDGFTIDGCTLKNCAEYAMRLRNTTGCLYIKNTLIDNPKGIYLYGIAKYVLENVRINNATIYPTWINDGDAGESAVINGLTVDDSNVLLLGNTKVLTVNDLHVRMLDSDTSNVNAVAVNTVNYGFVKNSIIDKGSNAVSKTGLYLKSAVGDAFVANTTDNIIIADTAINDARVTT